MASNAKDITGQRFGRLIAVKVAGRSKDGHIQWECLCDCGKARIVVGAALRIGKGGTRSCGCLRSEVSRRSKRVPWNKGATYAIRPEGERVYKQKHSWSKAALRAKGNQCEACGWDKAKCDVHHIVPRRQGGLHVVSNARVLCPNCHRVEHEMGPTK